MEEGYSFEELDKINNNNYLNEKELKNIQQQIYSLLLQKDTKQTTEKIVIFIIKNNFIKSIRSDEKDEIWIYNNGIYIPEGKTYIQEICRNILEIAFTTYLCNQVINKIQADTYISQEDFFNQQNKYPYLIPVENGILDIKNNDLLLFDPFYYFFNKIHAKFNKNNECPNIIKFVKQILPENREDLVSTIQELFGYSLIKNYKYEKSFMFEGIGRNGKSKLISLFNKFLGVENCSNIDLQTLEQVDSFQIVNLHNKLLNISADISSNAFNNTGLFKKLTGNDEINANRKFKNSINFTNYAKMIFATNELPFTKDISDGFWDRWVLIEFPNKFIPQKELNNLTKEEIKKKNIKLQDSNILKNISSEEEMSGLLNWALDGLYRLELKKDFSCIDSMKKIKKTWIRKSNSVEAFCDDCIEISYKNNYVSKQDFRKQYADYCRDHNIKGASDKQIKITLINKFSVTEGRTFFQNNQERIHTWEGIKFKDSNNQLSNKIIEELIFFIGKQRDKSEVNEFFIRNNVSVDDKYKILEKLKNEGELIETNTKYKKV